MKRYAIGTPSWKIMMDYYIAVADGAESIGKKLKAKWFRWKANKEFLKAGGEVINA